VDAVLREQRAAERAAQKAAWQALVDELEGRDLVLEELCDRADLVAVAALLAAGYRRRNCGPWRKRRVPRDR
jgi:hypothetical protein